MKITFSKRPFGFSTLLLLFLASPVFSQSTQTLAAWNPVGLSNAGPSPWTAASTSSNMSVGDLIRGVGITTTAAQVSAWGGVNWSAAASASTTPSLLDATFTMAVNPGSSVSYSTLTLSYKRTNTGPASGTFEYAFGAASTTYSVAGIMNFSAAVTGATAMTPLNLSTIPALQNVPAGTIVKFRIFPQGGNSIGSWWIFGSAGLKVIGTIGAAAASPSLNITNNGSQPAAANISQSSNNNILQSFVVTEGNVAAATLSNVTVPLAGNYTATDIGTLGLKLYANTTNNFNTATVVASKTSTSLGAGESLTFTNLNYAIPQNGSRYFWVTADISALASVAKTINAAALSASNFAFAAGTVTAAVSAGGVQTISGSGPVLTQLQSGFCGYTASSYGEFISADTVAGATQYEFQLVNSALSYTQTWANTTGSPDLALYLFPGLVNNTSYTTTVRWNNGSSWSAYGPACTLTTPMNATTQLNVASCGSSPANLSTLLFANNVSGATQYRFQLVNAALSYTQVVTKNNNNFNLAQFSGLTNNTTYTVTVGVFLNGAWDIYGPACTITTPGMPTTQLSTGSCGSSPASYSQLMFADAVPGATQYEYQLVNASLSYTQSFVKTNNNFNLALFTGLSNNTAYTVTVRPYVNSIWSNYGSGCNVTTPGAPTTQLSSGSCGSSPASFNVLLFADAVAGATQYEYQLVNAALSYTQSFVKSNNNFNLALFTNLAYNSSYSVSVRVNMNNTWGSYGSACNIATPAAPVSQLSSGSCGSSPASFSTLLFADAVNGATQYEYQLVNTALSYTQSFVKTNNNFNLNLFSGLAYSSTYSVSVRVFMNNAWGNYGSSCNVTTPAAPVSQLSSAFCGYTASTYTDLIVADVVSGATQYEYQLVNAAASYTQSFVKVNQNFMLSQFSGLSSSTAYSVQVRVFFNGAWGNYGPVCTVTTPNMSAPVRMAAPLANQTHEQNMAGLSLEATAYPNPYSDYFTLDLNNYLNDVPVSVSVVNNMGSVVETHLVWPEQLRALSLGNGYQPGIYTILVSQAQQTRYVKVVKP